MEIIIITRKSTRITQVSSTGISLIKQFEGFSAKPYRCPAGVATIGYGATYYPNGKRVSMADKAITEAYACELLAEMVKPYATAVDSFTTDTINQNQFDALVSFAYNVGNTALKNSSLLQVVNANPNNKLIAGKFAQWNKAAGKILAGLTRRRSAETKLYFSYNKIFI